jgi:hypothetical protein
VSDAIRAKILIILDAHDRSGSSQMKGDEELALEVREPLREIQRQLDILESGGLAQVIIASGPHYSARITPQGLLELERMREGQNEPPKRKIGF